MHQEGRNRKESARLMEWGRFIIINFLWDTPTTFTRCNHVVCDAAWLTTTNLPHAEGICRQRQRNLLDQFNKSEKDHDGKADRGRIGAKWRSPTRIPAKVGAARRSSPSCETPTICFGHTLRTSHHHQNCMKVNNHQPTTSTQ